MKLGGYRTDGTLRVLLPGGITILLRGDLASPPLDDRQADALGPWIDPPVALSWGERQELAKRLDRSRMVPAQTFALAKAEEPAWISDDDDEDEEDEKALPDDAEEEAPADAPPAPTADDAMKGELLAQIKKIADARDKEKAVQAAKKLPRFGKKRLKLEYEVEDREGEDAPAKKDDAFDEKKSPFDETKHSPFIEAAHVPDHLQPMGRRS